MFHVLQVLVPTKRMFTFTSFDYKEERVGLTEKINK